MAESKVIADAKENNWVDRFAPSFARPFLKLARFDRPIGTWLLLWPCWWGVALAIPHQDYANWKSYAWCLTLFAMGAVVMRGAGCAYNDIMDRKFDGMVERTSARPLASGQVTLTGAIAFTGVLVLLGLAVLLQFNMFTIYLGAGSLVLVGIYPLMKRFTYWPQLFLGLAFNWGALLGYAAVTGTLDLAAVFLYLAGIFWTLGYDTIYAHQDKTDDILIGVKSTALKFGENTRAWVFVFYGMTLGLLVLAGFMADLHGWFYLGVIATLFHFRNQLRKLDIHDPENCLRVFKSNLHVGTIIFVTIMLTKVF